MSFDPGGGGIANANDVALSNPANNEVLTYVSGVAKWENKPASGAGSSRMVPSAFVYQSGGNTIAVDRTGSTISSMTTSAGNNVTVINAAINAIAGTQVNGSYGGGGLIQLSDDQYLLNAPIVLQYGVSLSGTSATFDRGGSVPNPAGQTMNGTSLRAATNNIKLISAGTATSSGVHKLTNPHGCVISDIQVDGHTSTGITGVYIIDTADVLVLRVSAGDCAIGIDVDSTQPPNTGGTVACKIIQCNIFSCDTGININGASGGTDGEITSCRILTSQVVGVNMHKGGWQMTQCHFSGGHLHIDLTGSGTMISNNYFDTSGADPQIAVGTGNVTITANYFISAGGQAAAITMSGNGYRSIISSNSVDAGSGNMGFVKLPGGTISGMETVIVGNSVDTHLSGSWVSIVINNSNGAVADQDTTNGPYIKGNREWLGS